jgi:hypothetical protein
MSDIFTEEHMDESKGFETLGPHYFSARDFMERTMAAFEAKHFQPMIEKFRDEFYRQVQDSLESSLFSNVEANLQGEIWRTVDRIVEGLLSGEDWIVKRYVLGEKYECDKIRATVARHVPRQLQDARVADLESELARLRKDFEWISAS